MLNFEKKICPQATNVTSKLYISNFVKKLSESLKRRQEQQQEEHADEEEQDGRQEQELLRLQPRLQERRPSSSLPGWHKELLRRCSLSYQNKGEARPVLHKYRPRLSFAESCSASPFPLHFSDFSR
jgi:hypothetical protein